MFVAVLIVRIFGTPRITIFDVSFILPFRIVFILFYFLYLLRPLSPFDSRKNKSYKDGNLRPNGILGE